MEDFQRRRWDDRNTKRAWKFGFPLWFMMCLTIIIIVLSAIITHG